MKIYQDRGFLKKLKQRGGGSPLLSKDDIEPPGKKDVETQGGRIHVQKLKKKRRPEQEGEKKR